MMGLWAKRQLRLQLPGRGPELSGLFLDVMANKSTRKWDPSSPPKGPTKREQPIQVRGGSAPKIAERFARNQATPSHAHVLGSRETRPALDAARRSGSRDLRQRAHWTGLLQRSRNSPPHSCRKRGQEVWQGFTSTPLAPSCSRRYKSQRHGKIAAPSRPETCRCPKVVAGATKPRSLKLRPAGPLLVQIRAYSAGVRAEDDEKEGK